MDLISKFLDPEVVDFQSLKKIRDVLALPLSSFKFIDESQAKIIKSLFKIENIEQINVVDIEEPFKKLLRSKTTKTKVNKILKDDPELEEKLKKAISISFIIHRINREDVEKKTKEQKIIVIGLNNAGKTAILSKFGDKLGIKDLANLKPTRGIDHQKISTGDMELAIWDFGGQKDYRNKYLRQPEKYFFGIDLVIFVLDIQDTERYSEAIKYFDSIVEIITRLEMQPFFIAFIHKFDPDIRDNTDLQLNLELVQDLIKSVFKGKKLDYEVYLSSIFSMISKEPKFAQFLKEVMKEGAFIEASEQDKIEIIGKIVENSMNIMVQLSESVMKRFSEVENRITALEMRGKIIGRASGMAPRMAPSPIYASMSPPTPSVKDLKTPPPKPRGGLIARSAVVSELQELFAKRRMLNEN